MLTSCIEVRVGHSQRWGDNRFTSVRVLQLSREPAGGEGYLQLHVGRKHAQDSWG